MILAAGRGKRMHSRESKTLHPLGGKPLLEHILQTVQALSHPVQRIHVVIPPVRKKYFAERYPQEKLHWVEQPKPEGTGAAAACALEHLQPDATALILPGDMPLLQTETLQHLLETAQCNPGGAILTARNANCLDYGRILRDKKNAVCGIVEATDATEEQRAIRELNAGVMALPVAFLARSLPHLATNNAQGERYLTDVVRLAWEEGTPVDACEARHTWEVQGVNTPAQLAEAERIYQKHQAGQWMERGLRIADPMRFDLRGELEAGEDVFIDIGVILEGKVALESGVQIGAHCILRDVHIARDVIVKPYSILEDARVGAGCTVGPYARLRPGTVLEAGACVGNFVEVKKSRIGAGSKANHLSYIGDAEVGAGVNVGAGVITCNYDGEEKHPTQIAERAFIGSNASLVAPVKIGPQATVAAGSVINEDVPGDSLAVARERQRNIPGWKPRSRKKN